MRLIDRLAVPQNLIEAVWGISDTLQHLRLSPDK